MLIGSVAHKPHLVTVLTGGCPILYNPDTGADVTLLDPNTYQKMRPRPPLLPSNVKLLPYRALKPLEIKGCFKTNLAVGDKSIHETVFVTRRHNRGISLLSREASKTLGFVTINIPAMVGQVTESPPEGVNTHPLLEDFDDICQGVG